MKMYRVVPQAKKGITQVLYSTKLTLVAW